MILSLLRTTIVLLILLQSTSTNALKQDEVSMGTTILAVRYDGGVVVGADTRTSVSGYVSNRYAAKLTFVLDRNVDDYVKVVVNSSNKTKRQLQLQQPRQQQPKQQPTFSDDVASSIENAAITTTTPTKTTTTKTTTAKPTTMMNEYSTCVICRSGSAADTQALASAVRTDIVSRQLLHDVRGTVTHVASLCRTLLVQNDGRLSASLICAGYDHARRSGALYGVSGGGTAFEERMWAAGGSGSSYILGYLDSRYPANRVLRSEEEAVGFVSDAIALAMERDGSSGGFIRMYVIDRFGKRFVSTMPRNGRVGGTNNGDMEEEGGRSGGGGVTLRNFAPAVVTTPVSSKQP
mmetsp:Transcript_135/g.304  ORF Transcript_135/g.304 Transcript_135/m.304 type:complete len:349 (-) Transcript_135:386-1432(-)